MINTYCVPWKEEHGEISLESFWTPLTSHHKYILMFCFICDKIYWNLTEYTNCDSFHFELSWLLSKVLYMSFDSFLLAVELLDLSQADKNLHSYHKLQINRKYCLHPFEAKRVQILYIPSHIKESFYIERENFE